MIAEYRVARHADELAEEAATLGYETELRLRRERGLAPITFKQWLLGSRGSDGERPADGAGECAGDLADTLAAVGW